MDEDFQDEKRMQQHVRVILACTWTNWIWTAPSV